MSGQSERAEALMDVAERAARWRLRRLPRGHAADLDELRSAALLEIVKRLPLWREERGPLEGFLFVCAVRATWWEARASCGVSGRAAAGAVRTVPLEDLPEEAGEEPGPDAAAVEAAWRAEVRRALAELEDGEGEDLARAAAAVGLVISAADAPRVRRSGAGTRKRLMALWKERA